MNGPAHDQPDTWENLTMSCTIPAETLSQVIAFHGHSCPGLAIGIRAAELALRELEHPPLTELVSVVETDMCGVDAIQFLTGCTLGKGNLIHRDYGKMAFSFHDRRSGRGIRLLMRPEARGGFDQEMGELMAKVNCGTATDEEQRRLTTLRGQIQQRFMELPLEKMFELQELTQVPPRPPLVLASLPCEACGEKTMESRTRRFGGRTLCIPCFAKVEQKA